MSASKETPNMSCYHGASKPVYVDEELLQEAVLEQGLQDQAERIAKEEGIHYNDALRLSLEYRNIRRIDHLWEFTSLTKLNLNNNFIKKMEGLNHLVNLTWLNLSFNNIEKIEGLEGLQKLEVLKLSNNRISFVENMDNLVELTILCLANNLLQQLNNVVYLRRFKKLFTLNIEGNPIPEESCEDKYLIFIAAYFQQLKFLNNIFLNEDIRNRAHIKYNLDIEEMNQGELQRQQAVEENRKQEAELQRHEDAFVEQMNGSHLYNNIFQNDTEADKLHCLPGVDELLERIKELQELIDAKERKSQVDNCHKEINLLCYNLMTVEFQLYSHMEETIRKFDNNISEMTSSFSETAQGIFVHCRELEESHHKSIQQIANTTVEMVAKGESEDELPDDVRMLFLDKNTVTDTLAASHDNHVQTINDRETQLVTRAEAWKVALIKGIEDTELRRNRMRIADIHRYADYLRGQLEKFQ
ncbi:dynein regulatory complex subunit 3 isoform X2 [Nerophis lumbriciformis]|uniref:dynein regulatory complex subunit 3 isoform X2 n=1 Tax=Nerophis lumbriciformis TaxID=546530 RepID=UPI002ADF88AB|nr:dynein regulatory complex subunit 3-like isoform X2 [Nerophis lumbriciformis]